MSPVWAQRAKRRKDDTFGLIILDVDDLKKINDEFGHFEGDYALRTAVELIKSTLKKTDILARTGGDEFLIILDCKTKDRIEHVTEKIKAAFGQHNETANKKYKLDCSFGAELFHSDFSET